jgi:hypothetical protein
LEPKNSQSCVPLKEGWWQKTFLYVTNELFLLLILQFENHIKEFFCDIHQ